MRIRRVWCPCMAVVAMLSSTTVYAANAETLTSVALPDSAPVAGLVGNPVGLMRFTVPPAAAVPVSFPLMPINQSLKDILQEQLAIGDQIIFWNNQTQQYEVMTKIAVDEWNGPSDDEYLQLALGTGFWVRNRGEHEKNLILVGRIPVDSAASIAISPGYNVFGYPFAATVPFTDSALGRSGVTAGASPAHSDQLISVQADTLYWLQTDGVDVHWMSGNLVSLDGRFGLGQAYWYRRITSEPFLWLETSPYDGAFSSDPAIPQIVGLRVDSVTGKAILGITTDPQSIALLDVYYQDVVSGQDFDPLQGWQVAGSGIAVSTAQGIEWTDIEPGQRPPLTALFARFYLAVPAGFDIHAALDTESTSLPVIRLAGSRPIGASGPTRLAAQESTTVFYVDSVNGDNAYDGLTAVPGDGHGPKKDIAAGLDATANGDEVQVASGTYTNENLWSLGDRSLVLRPIDSVIIN